MRAFKNMAVVPGAGVGGASLIYANVAEEAETHTFARGWPTGLDFCALRESYAKGGGDARGPHPARRPVDGAFPTGA